MNEQMKVRVIITLHFMQSKIRRGEKKRKKKTNKFLLSFLDLYLCYDLKISSCCSLEIILLTSIRINYSKVVLSTFCSVLFCYLMQQFFFRFDLILVLFHPSMKESNLNSNFSSRLDDNKHYIHNNM